MSSLHNSHLGQPSRYLQVLRQRHQLIAEACVCCRQPVLESQLRRKLETGQYVHRVCSEQSIPNPLYKSHGSNRGSCLACGEPVLVTQQRVRLVTQQQESQQNYLQQKCHESGMERDQALCTPATCHPFDQTQMTDDAARHSTVHSSATDVYDVAFPAVIGL